MTFENQMIHLFVIILTAFGSGFATALAIVQWQDATKSLQDAKKLEGNSHVQGS